MVSVMRRRSLHSKPLFVWNELKHCKKDEWIELTKNPHLGGKEPTSKSIHSGESKDRGNFVNLVINHRKDSTKHPLSPNGFLWNDRMGVGNVRELRKGLEEEAALHEKSRLSHEAPPTSYSSLLPSPPSFHP